MVVRNYDKEKNLECIIEFIADLLEKEEWKYNEENKILFNDVYIQKAVDKALEGIDKIDIKSEKIKDIVENFDCAPLKDLLNYKYIDDDAEEKLWQDDMLDKFVISYDIDDEVILKENNDKTGVDEYNLQYLKVI